MDGVVCCGRAGGLAADDGGHGVGRVVETEVGLDLVDLHLDGVSRTVVTRERDLDLVLARHEQHGEATELEAVADERGEREVTADLGAVDEQLQRAGLGRVVGREQAADGVEVELRRVVAVQHRQDARRGGGRDGDRAHRHRDARVVGDDRGGRGRRDDRRGRSGGRVRRRRGRGLVVGGLLVGARRGVDHRHFGLATDEEHAAAEDGGGERNRTVHFPKPLSRVSLRDCNEIILMKNSPRVKGAAFSDALFFTNLALPSCNGP